MASISRSLPLSLVNKAMKGVCKLRRKDKMTTGFFIELADNQRYLVTAGFFLNKQNINEYIMLELWNKKIVKFIPNNRFIRYYERPDDVAIAEIRESDNLFNDIECLNYDKNSIKAGYEIYKGKNIFSIQYPGAKEAESASGKILNIENKEFNHNMSTSPGSAGCPVILLDINIDRIKVIGVHNGKDYRKELGIGTFIGDIIHDLLNSTIKKNNFFIDKNVSSLNANKINNQTQKNNFNGESKKTNFSNNSNNIKNLCKDINKIKIDENPYQNKIKKETHNLLNQNLFQPLKNNSKVFSNNNNSVSQPQTSEDLQKVAKLLDLTDNEIGAITLYFLSSDQSLNYAVRCKNTDKFNFIVNKMLEKEPSLLEKGFYFLCNGTKINEYKNIKDNKLKNGDKIIMQLFD